MSTVPVTEEAIKQALQQVPPERWPQVLAFIDSLRPSGAAAAPASSVKCWTAAELRKLPPAARRHPRGASSGAGS